ncbi:MAG: hypothetical protein VKL39_20760 [Leptolyngbyaceae bacterium]|nr:hypothetical protein [Leptolyngbyaceae bacterium]
MTNQVLHALQAIAKRFFLSLVCVVMLLSFTQTAALAASFRVVTPSVVILGTTDTAADEDFSKESLSEKREQRREWQSRVSGSREMNNENADNKTLRERFNIDEITETMKDNLNLDENADAKAAQQNYPSSR